MATSLRGESLTETLPNFPAKTERLHFIPEEPKHGGISESGSEVSNHFSVHVSGSWPPVAVEPPTRDALGWKRFYVLHIEPDGQKKVIGVAGIAKWPSAKRTIQIGMALVPEYHGRRLGEEAVAALGKWALSQSDCDFVVCDVPEGHSASAKSLERAGFVKSHEVPASGFLRFVLTR